MRQTTNPTRTKTTSTEQMIITRKAQLGRRDEIVFSVKKDEPVDERGFPTIGVVVGIERDKVVLMVCEELDDNEEGISVESVPLL